MKEVVKVSISGIAFSFDAEAYQVMKDYLDKLETGYAKKPDGREIVADIEARIAELILNEQESDNVVSRALAESVVAQARFSGRFGYGRRTARGEDSEKALPESRRGGTRRRMLRTGCLFPYRPRMDKARILPADAAGHLSHGRRFGLFSVRCSSCSSSCTSFSG